MKKHLLLGTGCKGNFYDRCQCIERLRCNAAIRRGQRACSLAYALGSIVDIFSAVLSGASYGPYATFSCLYASANMLWEKAPGHFQERCV